MQYRLTTYAEDVWDVYWFERNLQGDIVGVYNTTGTKLISYTYDAWGNFTTTYYNNGASTTAVKNPFRYRGYYYDEDLGLYYLQTRYYDSVTGRFISADSYVSTGQGVLGNNMFAYCNNNPVMYIDRLGEEPISLAISLGLKIVGVIAVVATILAYDATHDQILTKVVSGAIEATKRAINTVSNAIYDAVDTRDDTNDVIVTDSSPEDIIIYRYYASKTTNLSPRVGRDYDGLSFSTVAPRPGVKAVATTVGKVNATGLLVAVQTSPTHFLVLPTNGSIKEWMDQGMNSIWSKLLSEIIFEMGQ